MKNGRNDGFGVDPTDKLSISGPESSPSQHDNESNSWNNASNSRSLRSVPAPRAPPSISSGTLKRFNSVIIFCLKFRCYNIFVADKRDYWHCSGRTPYPKKWIEGRIKAREIQIKVIAKCSSVNCKQNAVSIQTPDNNNKNNNNGNENENDNDDVGNYFNNNAKRAKIILLTWLILAREPLIFMFSNSLSLSAGFAPSVLSSTSPSFSVWSSFRYLRRSRLHAYRSAFAPAPLPLPLPAILFGSYSPELKSISSSSSEKSLTRSKSEVAQVEKRKE